MKLSFSLNLKSKRYARIRSLLILIYCFKAFLSYSYPTINLSNTEDESKLNYTSDYNHSFTNTISNENCVNSLAATLPANNSCETAFPLCEGVFQGNTGDGLLNDRQVALCDEERLLTPKMKSLWFTFIADDSGMPIEISIKNDCSGANYESYDGVFIADIWRGSSGCSSLFTLQDCFIEYQDENTDTSTEHILTVEEPRSGGRYFLELGGVFDSVCDVEITPLTGIEQDCCRIEYEVTPICYTDKDFFVELQIQDLGYNFSGYSVNNGVYPDLISRARVEIGPFNNDNNSITLTGLDNGCESDTTVVASCDSLNIVCENAEPYLYWGFGGCNQIIPNSFTFFDTEGAALDLIPSCLTGEPNDFTNAFYKIVVPESGSFEFVSFSYTPINEVSLTIYDSCGGAELYCNINPEIEIFKNYTPGDTLILQLWRQNNFTSLDFCIQELPGPPENDLCENALEICNYSYDGSNINAINSPGDPISSCGTPQSTVWYRFIPDSNEATQFSLSTRGCINYLEGGYSKMMVSIYSGTCGGPYLEEYCQLVDPSDGKYFTFENPVVDQEYYMQISSLDDVECAYEISIIGSTVPCCKPEYTYTTYCINEAVDSFYIDIEVTNLDGQSGFILAGGTYPDIITPGTTTIGPIYGTSYPLTLVSTDDPKCSVFESVNHYCGCSIFEATKQPDDVVIILEGDSTLLQVIYPDTATLPGLHPFDCTIQWVTDIDDPEGSLIGTGEDIYVTPTSSTTSYYAIINCTNGLSCQDRYIVSTIRACEEDITDFLPYIPGCKTNTRATLSSNMGINSVIYDTNPTIDYENNTYTFTNGPYPCNYKVEFTVEDCDEIIPTEGCDSLVAVASVGSGSVLNYGPFFYYEAIINLVIEDTTPCDFLYWTTSLSDPVNNAISIDETTTVSLSSEQQITYYGIVECQDDVACVEEVSVTAPFLPSGYSGEPGYPGYPEEPEEPEPGEGNNSGPCLGITAGALSTQDKYVCFGDVPDVTLIGTTIQSDYEIYYAYHNSAELSESSFIYAFSFDDLVTPENVLPCSSTIYLTAFVAPTVGNINEISLADNCGISNSIEITYLCPVEIQVQEICNSNGTYNLAVTVTGGLPQVLGNLPFSIYGTVYKGNAFHGEAFVISNLPDGSNYQIEAVDSEMCHDWVTGSVQCDKLPVELLTFEGEAQTNGNLLKWSTAAEIDNDYFTIESSKNGIDFIQLGVTKGAGNSSTVLSYQFLDRQAVGGITYYRLSQTDFDGSTNMEATTEVSRGEVSGITLINTYPIPFLDELNLQLYSTMATGFYISLTDIIGREVVQMRFELQQGFNEFSLSTSFLPKGLYLIAIKSEEGILYQKVIKD